MACHGRIAAPGIDQTSSAVFVVDCGSTLGFGKFAVAGDSWNCADWRVRRARPASVRSANLRTIFCPLQYPQYTQSRGLADADAAQCDTNVHRARSSLAPIGPVGCRGCMGSVSLAATQAAVALAGTATDYCFSVGNEQLFCVDL